MTNDVEPIQPAEMTNRPLGQMSFAQLRDQATAIVSEAQLEQDKLRLLGVPFVATRLTFRPGITDAAGNLNDYVSVEAVIGGEPELAEALRRGWIPNASGVIADLPFRPNEKVVFNDGSTGVRRQFVTLLWKLGLIEIEGVAGDAAIFDTPYFGWKSFSQHSLMNGEGDEKLTVPDFTEGSNGTPLAIFADHGLRLSEFPNPANPKDTSRVFYLS